MHGFDSQHDLIQLFLCAKGSKVLDLSIVRGEGRATEITAVMSSARFNELENIYFVS